MEFLIHDAQSIVMSIVTFSHLNDKHISLWVVEMASMPVIAEKKRMEK